MGEEVKVFGAWLSPFSFRVELALKLKGVEYEYIEEDVINKNNKSPLLLKYNPVHKKIPVLLHNGKPIAESLVILEYIDQTWKSNPILPLHPYDRAMARFWAKFIDDKCLPALFKARMSPEKEEREKGMEEACECLKMLESEVKGKRLFGGDSIGLVDIAASFIAYWLRLSQQVTKQELLCAEKFPDLFRWCDEFVSCSLVKESLPPKDKLLAFFKARFAARDQPQSSSASN